MLSHDQTTGNGLSLTSGTSFNAVGNAQWTARQTAPALLSVCQESRFEAKDLYHHAFGKQLKTPILFNPWTDVVLFANGFSMEVFFSKDWSHPEEDNHQSLLRLCAVLEEDDGSRSWVEWVRDRQISRASAMFDNLEMFAFVNIGGTEMSWDSLERLIDHSGELVEALGKSTGISRARERPDIVLFACKDAPVAVRGGRPNSGRGAWGSC